MSIPLRNRDDQPQVAGGEIALGRVVPLLRERPVQRRESARVGPVDGIGVVRGHAPHEQCARGGVARCRREQQRRAAVLVAAEHAVRLPLKVPRDGPTVLLDDGFVDG